MGNSQVYSRRTKVRSKIEVEGGVLYRASSVPVELLLNDPSITSDQMARGYWFFQDNGLKVWYRTLSDFVRARGYRALQLAPGRPKNLYLSRDNYAWLHEQTAIHNVSASTFVNHVLDMVRESGLAVTKEGA